MGVRGLFFIFLCLFAYAVSLPIANAFDRSACLRDQFKILGQPHAVDLILDRLFAVHATNTLPTHGTLLSGATRDNGNDGKVDTDRIGTFRPTLHFALGELVRPHQHGGWEREPYAVITPLRTLMPQGSNLNFYDTTVIGDFKLPPQATLLLPEDVPAPPGPFRIARYKTGTETLRQAVDRVIHENGGWQVRMQPNTDGISGNVRIHGARVDPDQALLPVIEGHPHLSMGLVNRSREGEAYRLGAVEEALGHAFLTFHQFGLDAGTPSMKFVRDVATFHLEQLEKSPHPNPLAHTRLAQSIRSARASLAFLDAELELRRDHGLTLIRAPQGIIDHAISLRENLPALRKYLSEAAVQAKLPKADHESSIEPGLIANHLSQSPPQEQAQLLKFVSISARDQRQMNLMSAILRQLTIGPDRALREGTSQALERALNEINEHPREAREIAQNAFVPLARFFQRDGGRYDEAMRIIAMPGMRRLQRAAIPTWTVPDGNPTYDALLRSHPSTRGLFEAPPGIDPKAVRGHEDFLRRAGLFRFDDSTAKTNHAELPATFEEARHAALARAMTLREIEADWADLKKPMRDASGGESVKEHLRRGQRIGPILEARHGPHARGPGTPAIELWRGLGLAKTYRRHFPRDEDFWDSSESFLQIYERLKTPDREVPISSSPRK